LQQEVGGQTSEVSVKLISDLRLLTSVIDDIYDFNGFKDLPPTMHQLFSPSPS
jgi:hypothetical protein